MNCRYAYAMMLSVGLVQPVHAHAQRTRLSVSGFPVNFPAPTGADFAAGFITGATGITFTVDAQTGTTRQRTATVAIRCGAPCPTTGTKPLNELRWRRADLGTWNPLTTTDAVVETRLMFRNQPLPASNDPWSNTLFFQFALGWLADPPDAVANSYNIIMTLSVTVP
ncbi:MAG: hypothetical protein ACT4O1_02230 [Gemmatimonadota bacterium]